jgi:hypothetical protein
MKKLIWSSRAVAVLVALMFAVFSIDSLYEDVALGDRILNFMILITPGLMIMLVMIFFRHYYRISGLMYLGLGIIYFFFFRPYADFSQGWPVILLIVLPLISVGLIHLLYNVNHKSIHQ